MRAITLFDSQKPHSKTIGVTWDILTEEKATLYGVKGFRTDSTGRELAAVGYDSYGNITGVLQLLTYNWEDEVIKKGGQPSKDKLAEIVSIGKERFGLIVTNKE